MKGGGGWGSRKVEDGGLDKSITEIQIHQASNLGPPNDYLKTFNDYNFKTFLRQGCPTLTGSPTPRPGGQGEVTRGLPHRPFGMTTPPVYLNHFTGSLHRLRRLYPRLGGSKLQYLYVSTGPRLLKER